MGREALLRALLLALLLFWEFYQCPRMLAMASACLRYGTLTHILVYSMWGYLCFHSAAPQSFLVLEGRRTGAARSFLKSLLIFSLWFFLILCLSSLSILDQISKSVPNFLGIGAAWLWLLSCCIGATQAVLSIFVMPRVASMLTNHTRTFTTVASLFMSCFLPAAAVVYLDLRCFGGWALLWDQCRANAGTFDVTYVVELGPRGLFGQYSFKALQTNDVCSVRQSPLSLSQPAQAQLC